MRSSELSRKRARVYSSPSCASGLPSAPVPNKHSVVGDASTDHNSLPADASVLHHGLRAHTARERNAPLLWFQYRMYSHAPVAALRSNSARST